MVKQGCFGASGTKVAAEPEPDHKLRCQNAHLVENFENSKKCCTSWNCNRCAEPCIGRWQCVQNCDYDICETCFTKHWEDLVQQTCKSPTPFEAVQLLKAVPEDQRPGLASFSERAAHVCAAAVDDVEPFGGAKGLLLETVGFRIPPPAECSDFLSRQVHDVLAAQDDCDLSCDLSQCEAAIVLAHEYDIAPSAALTDGLNLSQARSLKDLTTKMGRVCLRLSKWQRAALAGLNTAASAELRESTSAGTDAVLTKIKAVRDAGAEMASDDFKDVWPRVVQLASEDQDHILELLLAVPAKYRCNEQFVEVAQTALNQKVDEALKDESSFLEHMTSMFASAVELGVPSPSESAAHLSCKARAAVLAEDDAGCEAVIQVAKKYTVEPSWDDLVQGLSLAQACKPFAIAEKVGAGKWQARRTDVLATIANEELTAVVPEGIDAVKSKLAVLKDSGVNMDSENLDPAWSAVLALATEDPGQALPLLIDMPPKSRSRAGESFKSVAAESVQCAGTVSESLDLCKQMDIAVPESVTGKLCDELCMSLEAKDWPAVRQMLQDVETFEVSLEAERLLEGFQANIETYCFLIKEQERRAGGAWVEALKQALPEVAAQELDVCSVQEEAPRLFLEACRSLVNAGVSVESLPNAGERAVTFLTLAVHESVSDADAQDLAQHALSCSPDFNALLESVPEEVRPQASDLLDTFAATWRCSPSGDSEVEEHRWLAFPANWSREAEQGYKRYTNGAAQDPRNKEHRRCKIEVDIDPKDCELKWEQGTSYAVDYSILTCMVTEPSKRGRIVPLRRYNKKGEVTNPPPKSKHPWYEKQVRDHDAKEGDWMSNDFFFQAFTEALKNAGVTIDKPAHEIFDFRFNEDFRDKKEDGRKLTRGGEEYRLPYGWKRFAVDVKGEYDEGDNAWLRSGDDGWAIAYHGTAEKNLPSILGAGFRVGPRQKFKDTCGAGVYCTPYVDVGAAYAPAQTVHGHTIQIVLQLRVKPSAIRRVTTGSDFEKKYWVINDPEDMRAYGVLIREAT